MVIDTSALLAILLGEREARPFRIAILTDPAPRLSAASYVEAALKVDRLPNDVGADLDSLIEELGLVVEPLSVEQARLARAAARRFGKGIHPAGLNFGDCLVYALAIETREPLLFKGEDFSRTDVAAVDFAATRS